MCRSAYQLYKNLLLAPIHFVPCCLLYILSVAGRYGKTKLAVIFLLLVGVFQLMLLNILRPGLLGFLFPGWMESLAPPVLRTTLADWAIYFPMGLVFGLNAAKVLPWSRRLGWLFGGLTVVVFGVGLLDALQIIDAPLARYLCPLPFILMLPGIKRESIPLARTLERVGRRTYGIYLTHQIVIYLVAEILLGLLPALAGLPILLSLLLFIVALEVPLLVMEAIARGPAKQAYRYVFG
jgi:peptidoglycan/LPS O-acetylase OafA/YrhL